MNKPLLLLISFIALFFSGCAKNVDTGKPDNEVNSLTFTISQYRIDDPDQLTRTNIGSNNEFFWSANDTVGIYPNTGGQVYFELAAGEGASSAKFDGGGWDFKASALYYSYYPFIGNIYLDRTHIPVSYLGQKQVGTESTSHIGPYDFMYTPGSGAESGNVSFRYSHLNCIIRFRLVLPAGTYSKLAITAPSEVFPIKGYYDLTADQPVIIPTKYSRQLSIDLEDITVVDQQQFNVYMMSAPVNLENVEVTVSVLNENKTELQCKKTPSKPYAASTIYGLGCTTWTEVPQSMSMFINDWENGNEINGNV